MGALRMCGSVDRLGQKRFTSPTRPPSPVSGFFIAAMSRTFRSSFATYGIVAASSLFFCSKAVFVKLAFRFGMDAVTVLALRMILALPFFLIGGALDAKANPRPISARDLLHLALLGFFGWYLSSVVNFEGLRHVSVGLERMILYTYPSMVVLGSVLLLGRSLRMGVVAAMLVSYIGIIIGYHAEASTSDSGNTLMGAGLVLASAVSYAIFVLFSGEMIARVGAIRFTSCVVGFSALFVLIHFTLTHPPGALLRLPREAYGCGVALAIFGTVIPSYLFGIGLKRAGSQAFAVIGMVGPLGTVFLAWFILAESVNVTQILGLLLTLGGGVAISLLKDKREVSTTESVEADAVVHHTDARFEKASDVRE
jgi:drug/metabolite transporter (DMT)-like permease